MVTRADVSRTFLFSDVERSTQLLQQHGRAMGVALARHHDLFERAVHRYGGSIFETVGDAVYAAFHDAQAAVGAALEAQIALSEEDWGPIGRISVRIALHTGEVEPRGSHYFGPALFRVARLQALAHGDQTLLSGVTAALVDGALPEGASLHDLGTHRLKDMQEPERVYQLTHPRLRADFPALRSVDSRPHNLPPQLSAFVGREAELREVEALVDEHRLVTLLGPGGIGKTRLALQAGAGQLERRRDGVFFIDLAPLRDPALVGATIAATLGLREQPEQTIEATLIEHLRDRALLLMLDNLEQLLPGADSLVGQLLASAPDLRILATSRAPLRLRGEREYPVPALSFHLADVGTDVDPPAVALFVDRARAVRPDLVLDARSRALVAAICERLDGLPLALELAAARLRVFSLPALHDRLDRRLSVLTAGSRDLPARQQTLGAAIAWSEELLAPSQRHLFAKLGLFGGGFTLGAAEAVAGGTNSDVARDLESLVEHSLVFRADDGRGDARLGMLESIREYAASRLSDTEAGEARRRHLAHYVSMVELDGDLAVDDELHNLRIAMSTAEAGGDGASILRIMIGTYHYWLEGAGRLREAGSWMERGLALGLGDRALRADALWRFAYLVDGLGDVPRAIALSEDAARLATALADDALLARILRSLGVFYARLGLSAEANEVLQRGLGHAKASGDTAFQRRILAQLAEVVAPASTIQGIEILERALELARADGDRAGLAQGLGTIGYFNLVAGHHDTARVLLAEAVSLLAEEPSHEDLAFALLSLAQACARSGERGEAVKSLAAALDHLSSPSGPIVGQFNCLLLAAACSELGEHDTALHLIGAADTAATANAVPFQRLEQVLRLRVIRSALRQRDRDAVRAAVAAGCADGWERAIANVKERRPVK